MNPNANQETASPEPLCMLFPVDELPPFGIPVDYWGTMLVFERRGPEFTITRKLLGDHPDDWLNRAGCYCYFREATPDHSNNRRQ